MAQIYFIEKRAYQSYQLSNEEIIEFLEGKQGKISDEQRSELNESLLSRFKHHLCKKYDESADDLFARQFGDFVNGKMESPKKVAQKMATNHRYLQGEMFKVCKAYIEVLAENYEKGRYDARNEFACTMAKILKDTMDNLK